MIEVDARGLSCPIPVIRVRETIEQNPGKEILVLIEEEVTRENVSRMAENLGMAVETVEDGLDIRLLPK